MTRGVPFQCCASCRLVVFPPRLACPACGGREWRDALAETGVAEEVTVVRHAVGGEPGAPRAIASVRADLGPLLIAGVDPGLPPGTHVELWHDGAVPSARPLPDRPTEPGG